MNFFGGVDINIDDFMNDRERKHANCARNSAGLHADPLRIVGIRGKNGKKG
jgi:hypothetical protein